SDRHRRLQDDRRDDRCDGDEIPDEFEDEPDDRDPVQRLVHQRIVASPPYVAVNVVAESSRPVFAPLSRKIFLMTGLTTRKNRIVACRTPTRSAGTPAWICIAEAPVFIAPNSNAASTIPSGLVRPSRATAIES